MQTNSGDPSLFALVIESGESMQKSMAAVLKMSGGRPGPESLRIAGPEREVRTLVVLNLIGLGKNNGTIIKIK